MKTKITIVFISLSLFYLKSYSDNNSTKSDSIHLSMKTIEGRWIHHKADQQKDIYIFRSDSTFFKAADTPGMLLFDVAGKYKLLGDSIRIVYQDLSTNTNRRATVKIMYFKILSYSDNELNASKIEDEKTTFFQLKRQ